MSEHRTRLRAMVLSALMGALGLTFPIAFHAVGLGNKFLPMLLPLLLNGFLVPARWAVLTGVLVPVISAVATGMPPLYPPVVLIMSCEGAVLGGVAALIYRNSRRSLWPALLAAVVAGRAAAFVAAWTLARSFGLPPGFASLAVLAQGLPGVALQIAVVPAVLEFLARRQGPLFAGDR